MKLRIAVSLTIIFIVVVGFSCHRKNKSRNPQYVATIQTNYETEQHAALSAVIRDMYVDDRTRLLVIAHADPCPTPEPTVTPNPKVEEMRQHMEDDGFQGMPELARETIDDFHARAKECHPLARKLVIPIDYELVGQKDLGQLFPKGEFDRAWTRFYTKYPKSSGIISSRIQDSIGTILRPLFRLAVGVAAYAARVTSCCQRRLKMSGRSKRKLAPGFHDLCFAAFRIKPCS